MGPARWLQRYAEVFDTVEVNSTFYRLPSTGAGSCEREGEASGSAACGALQTAERAAQQPRHVHLRVPDLLADLALCEVVHEAQLHHAALELWERLPGAGDRVAALHQLVGRVHVAEQVQEGARLVVLARGGRVQRRGLVARRGLARLQGRLDAAAHRGGHLADGRRAPELLGEDLGLAAEGERPLLQVAGHVQRPALVAEVALELTEDGGRRIAREPRPAIGLEAVDRLDEAEARDLEQVVQRLVRVAVAKRQVARERKEALHQLVASGHVAVAVIANEELTLGVACLRALALVARLGVDPAYRRTVRGLLLTWRYLRRSEYDVRSARRPRHGRMSSPLMGGGEPAGQIVPSEQPQETVCPVSSLSNRELGRYAAQGRAGRARRRPRAPAPGRPRTRSAGRRSSRPASPPRGSARRARPGSGPTMYGSRNSSSEISLGLLLHRLRVVPVVGVVLVRLRAFQTRAPSSAASSSSAQENPVWRMISPGSRPASSQAPAVGVDDLGRRLGIGERPQAVAVAGGHAGRLRPERRHVDRRPALGARVQVGGLGAEVAARRGRGARRRAGGR